MRRKSKGMVQRLTSFRRVGWLPLIFLWSLTPAAAQQSPKTLEYGDHLNLKCRNPGPTGSQAIYEIELDDILIDQRPVLIGEPFVGDVRELVFRVKNISDRPQGFIQITVVLPEVKRPPEIPFLRTLTQGKPTPVAPGEAAELRVPTGKLYDWVKDTVAAQDIQLEAIKRVAIDSVIVEKSGQAVNVCIKARDPRNEWRPKP
jgi:hypothetical protein